MKKLKLMHYHVSAVLLVLILAGCGRGGAGNTNSNSESGRILVTVSILPQQYFVQRIAGDRARVNVLVPSSQSPDSYEPTPRQIRELTDSQLFFRIGPLLFETVYIEPMLASHPGLKTINTSEGTPLIEYQEAGEVHSEHGQAGSHHGHEHGGLDPHTWVSPTSVKKQIQHIRDAFIQLDPGHRDQYETNYQAFAAEIDQLHQELTRVFSGVTQRKFMVFHPAFAYFARDYQLQQLAIEVAGKTPGPATIKQVIDLARKENIRFIIVQQQSDTNNARAVAEDIRGAVVFLDPLEFNWLENLKKIAKTLAGILKDTVPEPVR